MANQQVKYTITGENLLSKILKQVDVDAQKAENSVKNVSKAATNKTGGGGGMLGSIVGGNLIANGISKIGSSLVGFGKEVVDSLSKYEMFSSSLKTLMGGNGLAAEALKGQLVQLAKTTPFSLEDVQAGTKSLLAYGFQAGSITDDLKTLGDVSSAVGAPLNDIVYLYGTLKTQGRAFSKDITQFTGRGIPIVKELAKQFNVTEDKVMGLVSAGKVGFPQIEKAFKSMTSEGGQFFGMMEQQSKTIGGQISNMGDNWEQAKIEIGKSQTGIISGTVSFFGDLINQFKEYWQEKNFEEGKYKQNEQADLMDRSNKEKLERINTLKNLFEYTYFNTNFQAGDIRENKASKGEFGGKEMALNYNQKIMSKINEETDINNLENFFKSEVKSINEQFNQGTMSAKLRGNELLTLNELNKRILGLKALKTTPVNENTNTEEGNIKGGKGDKLGTGVTIEAQTPKNQYITINGGLVHEMKIESMDGSTPVAQIKEQVSTAMVELLNDAYQAIR